MLQYWKVTMGMITVIEAKMCHCEESKERPRNDVPVLVIACGCKKLKNVNR